MNYPNNYCRIKLYIVQSDFVFIPLSLISNVHRPSFITHLSHSTCIKCITFEYNNTSDWCVVWCCVHNVYFVFLLSFVQKMQFFSVKVFLNFEIKRSEALRSMADPFSCYSICVIIFNIEIAHFQYTPNGFVFYRISFVVCYLRNNNISNIKLKWTMNQCGNRS